MKSYFTFLLLLLTLVTSAQRKSFFMTIDQGPSIPAGKFKGKEFQSEVNPDRKVQGLARLGYQFSLSGGYFFNKHVGAMIQLGFSVNKQDKKSFEEAYAQTLGPNYDWEIKTEQWLIGKAMAGFVFNTNLPGKFFLEGKLLGGLSKTKEPGYEVSAVARNINQQPFAFQNKRSKIDLPASFAWQVNAGLGYQVVPDLYVLLDLNYFDSRPVYEFQFQSPGNPSQPGKYTYSLASVGINATVGVRL